MKKLNKKGFTLVEMLVVIAIIAVLVAIIVPTVTSSTKKAKAATDAANLRSALATATIKLLEDPSITSFTAEDLSVPANSKMDDGEFNCTVTSASEDSDTGFDVVVTYGGNDVDYYADIAAGGTGESSSSTSTATE